MPNIATLLKSEISRVARKEVRAEIQALKKASSIYRSEIAALKRRTQLLEKELKRVGRTPRPSTEKPVADAPVAGARFSADGLRAQRQRLELSAKDFGALVGASGLSIYKWESGKVRPQGKFLPALAAVRKLGKKEATRRLEALAQA